MARELWLLRHGDAEPHDARPDHERRLTARGEQQSEHAGAALAALGIEFAACYSSPKVRALDTARLACRMLNVDAEVVETIASGFDAEQAVKLLRAQDDPDAKLLLVGHNPDFAEIVAGLTGARAHLRKGALAVVRPADGGVLERLLAPRELEAISRGRA